jgi:uncharacterized protein YqjF (DUF2071 family)
MSFQKARLCVKEDKLKLITMFSFLQRHPFPVETFFESSLVLTYAVPKEELTGFLPECLQLDTFEDKWAFVAVAMVKTKGLRPKGFPSFMGEDFFLTGYRVFVRYTTSQGKKLRGLYILKSETDKKKMAFLGNLFTHYNYTTTDIDITTNQSVVSILSKNSDLNVKISLRNEDAALPSNSPFHTWKEARRFAGPLPFTFTYNISTREVLIIEGVRENWTPKPVEVIQAHVGFIKQLNFTNSVLANAFIIQNIPYYWKRGKTDLWKG